MNKRFFYQVLNILSLLTGVAAGVLLGLAVIGSVVEESLQWTPLISAFSLLITSVVLYALWDIGARLYHVEATQNRLAEGLRRGRDDASGN